MTTELPPLPEPDVKTLHEVDWNEFEPVGSYSALAMEDYARAYAAEAVRLARQQALEDAAGACDKLRANTLRAQHGRPEELSNLMLRQVAELGFGEAAFAIRALKDRT